MPAGREGSLRGITRNRTVMRGPAGSARCSGTLTEPQRARSCFAHFGSSAAWAAAGATRTEASRTRTNRMRKSSATLPATAGASKTRIRPVEPHRVRMRLS